MSGIGSSGYEAPSSRSKRSRKTATTTSETTARFDRVRARQRERRNRDGMRLLLWEQGKRERDERRRARHAQAIGLPRVAAHSLPMRC